MNTILFDMGGVLASDVWEALLLTPGEGLVDRLKLDRDEARRAGYALWEYYSTRRASEKEYWLDLEKALSVNIPYTVVEELESRLLKANPKARESVLKAKDLGLRTGIISNNTSFWFPKQAKLADIEDLIDPEIKFLSFCFGVQKNTPKKGLFNIAAKVVDPGQTYIVDNNVDNIRTAKELGFHGIHYSMHNKDRSLESVVISLG